MTGETDAPLSAEEITSLRKDIGDDAVDRELARRAANEKPSAPGLAADHGGTPAAKGGMTAEGARARQNELRTDTDFQNRLSGRGGHTARERALDEWEDLAKIASGAPFTADQRQAEADSDFAPRDVAEYTGFEPPNGNPWSDESRQELASIKTELFEAGVSPGAARAVFSEYGAFLQMDEPTHYSRVESAVNQFKQVNGEAAFADVQRYVGSLKSDNMRTAALVAGMSQLGLKELARLGRGMARKPH
jgi:hypothetical protein